MDGMCWLVFCLVGGCMLTRVLSYENLALNKSTWKQGDSYGEDRAVDGQKSSLSVYGSDCIPSTYTKTVEWRVDLGNILSIHHIFIQYATNNKQWDASNGLTKNFMGFSVYLSNTTNKEDGVLWFRDTIYSRATIPNPVIISCPYHGRFVIYYNNRTHYPFPDDYSDTVAGALCEVEVYGCPIQGFYGESCSIPCPRNCQEGHCHILKGTCLGCDDGLTGPTCETNQTQSNVPDDKNEQKHTRAPSGTKDNRSDSKNIIVLIVVYVAGVFVSVAVVVIVVACVIVFKRRRSKIQIVEASDNNRQAARSPGNVSTIPNLQDSLLPHRYIASNGTYNPEFEMNTLPRPHIINGLDHLSATIIHDIRDYDNNDGNVNNFPKNFQEEKSCDVPVIELLSRIAKMKRDNDKGFKTEFALLPNGELHPCFVAKHEENLAKNRYKTTFPYDHSRVILIEEHESTDYINANYVKDVVGDIAYIASQGPKANTVTDFWTMVWQEDICQVVMLTNLTGDGKMKCIQYWPELSKSMTYGHFAVENLEERHYACHSIRKFKVCHRKKHKTRIVCQYHYTMWPDHGIPDPLSLVIFHNHVLRTTPDRSMSSVVVHCSAGIGRTGTYIALDALYKEGNKTGKINVCEYVTFMRACRMNMVQTYEQYKTIFLALEEKFKACIDTHNLSEFLESVNDLSADTPANQTFIYTEFETLLQIQPEYTDDDYKEARPNASRSDGKILPLNKYTVYLKSYFPDRRNFINAVHVSTYLKNNGLIVTEYPQSEDAVDFLRLILDNKSDTIICMDPLSEIQSCTTWFPVSTSPKKVVPYKVLYKSESETDVKVTNIDIMNIEALAHSVVIVEPKGPLKMTGRFQDTLQLRSLLSYAVNASTENPIIIIDRDGASLSGVFCAVFNCIQQINMDDGVDVFTTVRQLQTRRPEFCSTLNDYWLIYRTLRDYIGTTSESVYSNQL
uniref:protein-tyrosine-phosphatase n=1 Tax=Crassostrea virginica TaxID=6565 RepID=A0A8B8BV35_CRAVI|nr:receptor-type tyrosine-protein phosphatase T-like isoform X1 [Crassostrea virginica]